MGQTFLPRHKNPKPNFKGHVYAHDSSKFISRPDLSSHTLYYLSVSRNSDFHQHLCFSQNGLVGYIPCTCLLSSSHLNGLPPALSSPSHRNAIQPAELNASNPSSSKSFLITPTQHHSSESLHCKDTHRTPFCCALVISEHFFFPLPDHEEDNLLPAALTHFHSHSTMQSFKKKFTMKK